MMLTLKTSKEEKAYIKKFQNGIGIRCLNQQTGNKSTVIIHKETSAGNKSKIHRIELDMKTNLTANNEGSGTTISIKNLREPNEDIATAINKYLESNKSSRISGLHILMEDDPRISHNTQQRSVLVANKDIAKSNGVYFTIPGTLMNISYVNSQENKQECEFLANTIIKPMTLLVGEYTLHIDISCKTSPDDITYKTVGTQTTTESVVTPIVLEYSHKMVTNNDISSLNTDLDLSELHPPQSSTWSTRAEMFLSDDTFQTFKKENSVEELSEGEFARLFNPILTKKSHSKTSTKKDVIENKDFKDIICYDLTSEELEQKVNQTERKSEHSIETFDSHNSIATHKHLRGNSTSQSLESFISSFVNDKANMGRCYNNFINLSSKNNFINSKGCDSKGKPSSSVRQEKSNRESESTEFYFKAQEGTIINHNNPSKKGNHKCIEINQNCSSINISIHEINKKLSNVASSLNQINSIVQMIDNMTQNICIENHKKRSVNDISNIENSTECNNTQSKENLCDNCKLIISSERPKHHLCDKLNESTQGNFKLEDFKSKKNEPNGQKLKSFHTFSEKGYSTQNNTRRNVWKPESLDILNVKYTDAKQNNIHATPNKDLQCTASRYKPNICKSTEVIHYNNRYQDCLSTTSESITHKIKNKYHKTQTAVNFGNSRKSIFQSDGINTFDDAKSIVKGSISKSHELLSIMLHKSQSSKVKKEVGCLAKKQNKNKGQGTSWSNNLRKIFQNREQIQFNIFRKRSSAHNLKKPAQQKCECSENTDILRFKRISDWIKTQFPKNSDSCLSSKTLHIVPSESKSKSGEKIIEQPFE